MELALIPATMAVSYLHGGDYVTKGLLVAGLALVAMAVLYPLGWYAIAGGLLSPFYWFLFRTSKQAVAELDYMDRRPEGSAARVFLAYALPIGISLAICGGIAGYQGAWRDMIVIGIASMLSWGLVPLIASLWRQDEGESRRENRAAVEIAAGLCGGVHLAAIAHMIGGL